MMLNEHSGHLKLWAVFRLVRMEMHGISLLLGLAAIMALTALYLGNTNTYPAFAFVIVGVVVSCLAVIVTLLTDVVRRAVAKDKFAHVISNYDPWELKEIKALIDQDSPTPYLDWWLFHDYPHQREFSKIGYKLRSLLREMPWGPIAAQALFQRSRVGRVRYFAQATERYSEIARNSAPTKFNADENDPS